jgi:hypothetical protein
LSAIIWFLNVSRNDIKQPSVTKPFRHSGQSLGLIAKIPEAFKGTPILYITAGLLSLAFLGFKGIIQ